ncbi:MAG: methanogenesis marker 14 protein [Candidatus Nezhaarchaeales archaeon]
MRLKFLKRKGKIGKYNPRIARGMFIDPVKVTTRGTGQLFTVASIELGNTTTKCIITTTDLKTGKIYLVRRAVELTRNIRRPHPNERLLGYTLWGKMLSEMAVIEFIRDFLVSCVREAGLDRDKDLHFVVQSTGISASFGTPEEVGSVIRALAKGCLAAGISPSKMIAPLSKNSLPDDLKEYSKLDVVFFDGAIAGCLPPKSGGEIMANEMEAELSTAGIKVGAKWTDVDCRNPIISMDFGTTFKGRVTNDELPYAKTIGSICGLSGAICDALIQGTEVATSALEFSEYIKTKDVIDAEKCEELAYEVHKYIDVRKVLPSAVRVGMIPINAKLACEQGVLLIGCDVGDNGSYLPKLRSLGHEFYSQYGGKTLLAILDYTSALIAKRVLETLIAHGLINDNYTIGITGRAGITGLKPYLILKYVDELGVFNDDVNRRVVFVEDGLALGANVMARCLHSLGTPQNPLGGNRGMGCILSLRAKFQKLERKVKRSNESSTRNECEE